MLEVDVVVVDELHRESDEGDIAGEAAVVEPVDADGGDAVDQASGVDGDDDEVGAGLEGGGDFTVERGESALVVADALLVYPDEGLVVCRTDVEEGARVGFGLEVEVALVPDDAFETEEGGVLGVPVAGNFEGGGGGEVVLFVVRAAVDVGMGIEGVAVVANLTGGGIEGSGGWLVDEVVPVSVQGCDGAAVYADEERLKRLLRKRRQREGTAGE